MRDPLRRSAYSPAPPKVLARVPAEFEELYREHVGFVLTNLARLGVHVAQLEDAAQDVFVTVFRRIGSFEGRASLRTWIYSILRNVAFRYRRTDARARRKIAKLAAATVPMFADLDRDVQDRQAVEILRTFLDTLDHKQREAFVLGEIERMTRKELGTALGVSPNTAYSRLRLARERFSDTFHVPENREALLERWREPPPKSERERRVWALLASQLAVGSSKATVGTTAGLGLGWKILGGLSLAGALAVPAAFVLTRPANPPTPRVRSAGPFPGTGSKTSSANGQGPRRATASNMGSTAQTPGPTVPPTPPNSAPSGKPRQWPARSKVTEESRDSQLAAELAELTRASKALARGDHAVSLRIVRDHRRHYPDSTFAVDLRVLEIDNLCGLGRDREARQMAERFLAQHGTTAHAARVRASCGVEE